jgi:gamma-glutamylcyclotransferase
MTTTGSTTTPEGAALSDATPPQPPAQEESGNVSAPAAGLDPGVGNLYFAYGSNLSSTQMAERCPNAVALGVAWLPGWDWIINQRRYANVVRRREDGTGDHPGVYGVLYRLPPADEARLDVHEGVPRAYEKVMLKVTMTTGSAAGGNADGEATDKTVEALVYVDFNNIGPGLAWPGYVGRMSRGVKEASKQWGFPQRFAETVMAKYIPDLEW